MGQNSFKESIDIAKMGMDEIIGKIKEVQDQALASAKVVRETLELTKDTGSPNEADEKIKKTTKIVNEFNQVTVKTNKHIQAMVSLEKQKQAALAKSAREQEKENKALEKKASLYLRVNQRFQKLKATYRDLALKQELGIKMSDIEIAKMKSLETQITKLDKAYKKVDGQMGVHHRNVGNYKTAFDSLGFSVAQLTRESPAFINSMQTGFMAISNNIPVFVDEIRKLNAENAELVKSGGKAKSVLTQVGKAFFSWQSLISVGIVLLTLYGPKLIEVVQGMVKFKGELVDMNELYEESSKSIGAEIHELDKLIKKLDEAAEGTEERTEAVEEIQKKYPQYLGNIDLEKAKTSELTTAIDKQKQAIIGLGVEKALQAKKDPLYAKIVEIELKRNEDLTVSQQATLKLMYESERPKAKEDFRLFNKQQIDNEILAIQGDIDALDEAGQRVVDRFSAAGEISTEVVLKVGKKKKGKKAPKPEEIIDNTAMKEAEEYRKAVEKAMNGVQAYLQERLKAQEQQFMSSEERQLSNKQHAEINKLQALKEGLDSQGGLYKSINKLIIQAQERHEEEMTALQIKEEKERQEKLKQIQQQKLEEQLDYYGQVAAQMAGIGMALVEHRIQALEREQTKADEKFENDMKIAEETSLSEEELANKQEALEEEKELEDKDRQKRINAERKKQAIIDRANALFQIAINTAIWASRVGAETGTAGFVTVPLVIALGALQAAAVLAAPLPQYKDGTENHPGGLAVLGDGGKAEAGILPDGSVFKSASKDTIYNLPAGTVVKPDYDAYMEEQQKQLYDVGLIRGLALEEIERKRDNDILNAINKQTDVLKKKRMSSPAGKPQDINHQMWRMNQINWA